MMADAKQIRNTSTLQQGALVVALARAGGSITYSEAEYQRVAERYGGTATLAIHVEVIKAPGDEQPGEARLTLIRKEPGNADLVT